MSQILGKFFIKNFFLINAAHCYFSQEGSTFTRFLLMQMTTISE